MTEASDRPRWQPEHLPEHYHIVSELGSGGMGVVSKAIDTRLNRAVAIKAINRTRLEDAGGAARLRAEALAAASLDHPYICKVYELIEEGEHTLIVMEFVEGETLAAILRRGALPIAETVRLASEIAEGLANAHEHGLVHRDVKPSNVMVTPHGHVKLLDFGLAHPDVASTPAARTQTSPDARAAHGGTPQYMAPEQATGAPVTARADLFSLGVVLFECLTGRLPFEGLTGYDYVRHLLSDAPRPLYRLVPDAPDALVRLVEQCLEKTPAKRPESAAGLLAELRRIADGLSTPAVTLSTIRATRARKRWRLIAAAGVLGAVALAGVWRWLAPPPSEETFRRLRHFTTSPGKELWSRLSPDGRWVAFLAPRGNISQLFVQQIDGNQAQLVTLPAGQVDSPVWSPDGQQLACVVWQGSKLTVQIVPAFFGGIPVQTISDLPAPRSAQLLRWIGRAIYLTMNQTAGASLQRLDLDRGTLVDLSTSWTVPARPREFDVRPDGKQVAYSASLTGQPPHLWVANLDGTSAARLTDDDAFFERYPVWDARGRSVIYQSNRGSQVDLWEISLATRHSRQLTTSPDVEVPESTTLDGSVSFHQVSEQATLWTWDSGGSRPLTEEALSDLSPTYAPGGHRLAFQRSEPSPIEGALLLDAKLFVGPLDASHFASPPRPVGSGFAAHLSPDGSRVAYFQRASGTRARLQVKHVDTDETLTLSSTCPLPAYLSFPLEWADQNLEWSPSGAEAYFVDQPGGFTIRRYRVGAPAADAVLAGETADRITDVYASFDGRTLAYMARSKGSTRLHLVDLTSGTDRAVIDVEGSTRAYSRGWTQGDRALVIVRPQNLNDDTTYTAEILLAGTDGALRPAGVVDRVFPATSRLDAARGLLYLTRSQDAIHNLFAFSLATHALRAVTTNTSLDVSFSGVEPLGGDRFVGVRDEKKTDIWLLDARPVAKPPPGAGGRRP
jgi:serine/threonine protein kinase